MKQLDPKIARDLAQSPMGIEFIEFVQGELAEMECISSISIGNPNFTLLAEVRGRQIAVQVLKKILSPLIHFELGGIMPVNNNEFNVDVEDKGTK